MRDAFGIGSGFRSAEVRIRDDWQQFLIPELQTSDLYSFKGATKMPAHVGAIGIGEFALAGIPAELFTEPGRRIRERSTFAVTSAMSLSNGLVGYVAERDAFFPGSYIYGVHPYLSAIAEPGSDSVLVDAALSALDDAWAQANA